MARPYTPLEKKFTIEFVLFPQKWGRRILFRRTDCWPIEVLTVSSIFQPIFRPESDKYF